MNKYLRLLIGAAVGGTLGYMYYYYIGCSTGHCPITSNWYISTAYGTAIGIVAAFPTKKKAKAESNDN